MGIDVVMQNEDGEPEERFLDQEYNLATALRLPGLDSRVCLRFIDPYGDTVFNQLQIPHLLAELEALRERLTDDTVRLLAVQRLEDARRAGLAEAIIPDYESAVERRSTTVDRPSRCGASPCAEGRRRGAHVSQVCW